MTTIRIILTGSGGPGGPGIIKSLRAAPEKFYIIGLDNNPGTVAPAFADKFYQVPMGDAPDYIKKLLFIAKREKVKIIFPLNTRELMNLARNKELFEKNNIRVCVSSLDSIRISNNKYLLAKLCQKIGVPSPRAILVNNLADFKKAAKSLSGNFKQPVCFKPPVSNGQRGFRVIDNKADQLNILLKYKPDQTIVSLGQIVSVLREARPFPELMVMEYLPGDEYTVDILADNGRALAIIPRLREEIKMGVSFRATVIKESRIIQYSARITKELGFHGIVGLQFKNNDKGMPVILEANPRLQGTNVLSTAAGVNLPYFAVKMLFGERIKIPRIKWGTKMIRYWNEIFYNRYGQIIE